MAAQSVRVLAVEAWRRAEAMGLVEQDARHLDGADIARLVGRVRDAGIARGSALHFDNVHMSSVSAAESLLRVIITALEASPLAKHEWPAVSRVMDPERLASLLGISVTSLRRYLSGERETPDDVAARLHHLALTIGDLAGAYNDVGIRRWFDRRRIALDGRTPARLLTGEWNPDDAGPQRVRELARSLAGVAAT
jgi:transcriptional regulator with XRE-family HTH domain